jgi:hypothetical protein
MNYKKIYENLIEKARLSNRKKGVNVYYEKHHIIPKCFGGSNKKENLVLLTAKEHFIAHLLLIQLYEGKEKSKMTFGLFQMCRKNSQHQRVISARQFEMAKLLMSENCRGENSNFYGKTHTDEVKANQSKKMIGVKNPMYGKSPWNKDKILSPLSEKHKKILSEKNKGYLHTDKAKEKISKTHKNKHKSEEHKEKISKKLKGNVRSQESIKKGSEKLKGKKQKLLICPYCNKVGGTTMHRWHFENCKIKN